MGSDCFRVFDLNAANGSDGAREGGLFHFVFECFQIVFEVVSQTGGALFVPLEFLHHQFPPVLHCIFSASFELFRYCRPSLPDVKELAEQNKVFLVCPVALL